MKTSKYYGVSYCIRKSGKACEIRWDGKHPWTATIMKDGRVFKSLHETEREAAIAVDRYILENNIDRPLNILKRKA